MIIVASSDDNYVAGAMVLIASVVRHNPEASFVLLDMGISGENLRRLEALAARLARPLQVIDAIDPGLSDIPLSAGGKTVGGPTTLTTATLARLCLPVLLPNTSRVIYADCDMVCTGALEALWALELGSDLLAGVTASRPSAEELEALNLPAERYINAGLLVMALDRWRAEGTGVQALDYLADPDSGRRYNDQSAINHVCRDRIRYLPAEYNFYSLRLRSAPPSVVTGVPKIIHFNGANPWQRMVPMAELWWHHADAIADLLPPGFGNRREARMRALRRNWRDYAGLLVLSPTAIRRARMALATRRRIIRPYLASLAAVPRGGATSLAVPPQSRYG